MKRRRLSLLLALFIAPSMLVSQDKRVSIQQEQTSFDESGPMKRPVPLSNGVMQALLKRSEIRDALRSVSDAQRRTPSQLFHASEIHLAGPDEVDLIVEGVEGRVSGADNDWYWVVRSSRTNPEVVLFAGCLFLDVIDTSTMGYRDIETSWNSAAGGMSRIYHFDGKQYKLWKEKNFTLPN